MANKSSIKYGTFNSHTSALSLICSVNLGSNPIIKRFKKGLSRLRPSRPRYNHTWDPMPLLQHIEKLNSPFNLQILSQKLVILLALVTGERLQTISLIRLSGIIDTSTEVLINISDPVKTSRVGRPQPTLHIPLYDKKPSLCVATTLKEYIARTRYLRHPENDYLFITTKKPFGTASKDTLSRWVNQILTSSGFDTTQFKPHSTRHAATSAVFRKGVSTNLICKTAGWSQTSTFARFYNRPLRPDNTTFANTILDLSLRQ